MDLKTAEHALQTERKGDVDALDTLLHPRVVAAGPDGGVFTKADDLESHRSGALRARSLVQEAPDVEEGPTTGRTRMTALVEAGQGGSVVRVRLVYNRLRVRDGETWRVLAATFSPT